MRAQSPERFSGCAPSSDGQSVIARSWSPQQRVLQIVDGRKGGAHSDSDMPAWADVFAKSTESAGSEHTAVRIDVLVKYLETLQVK